MSTYLKNMAGYKHELMKGSKTKAEGSSKRAGNELEQEKAKKQKADDDQEEAEMKRHIEIVKDDEVAIDAIPLATTPPVIVDYKIDKDGKMRYFKLIRIDGTSKRYSSMIKMLQGYDREDLETLWNLVKAKFENTRPEDDYERVLWGDFKVMFEPDNKSDVWINLQGYKVTVWKLFDNCGVHFISNKMEAGTTSTTLTARLPILNPGEYDLWLMRIEQNFLMTDYSLWEVILNCNKVLKRTVGETKQEYEPTTVAEKQDRRNEMKARGTLLMTLLNKDQLKFH
ncbi:hypothetical protein Tco_1130803 [Tanacetum coccineum]